MDTEYLVTCSSSEVSEPTAEVSLQQPEIGTVNGVAFGDDNSESADRKPFDGPEKGGLLMDCPPIIVSPASLSYGTRPRSPLRDGTELDDLHADRPFKNSVFARSDLNPVDPPLVSSDAFATCDVIKKRLLKMSSMVEACEAQDLPRVAVTKLAAFFGPKRKSEYGPKLPKHPTHDPIDPVVIFKKAVPLVHRVLLRDPVGNEGFDFDGIAYITERLDEALQLRRHDNDIRFDVLEALSMFLKTVITTVEMDVV